MTQNPDPATTSSPAYWYQARQPLACLVFLTPLLIVYEIGVLALGGDNPDILRNGADFWMRGWLADVGLKKAWLLPGLVVAGLLLWQWCGQFRWRFSPDTLIGMLAESLLFAFFLVVVGQTCDLVFHKLDVTLSMTAGDFSARAVTYIGAGVYEEFLFRLCLLPAVYGVFRLGQLKPKAAVLMAVLSTSLMFSLAHYIGPGEPFSLFTFVFRTLAGLFFAGLFVLRGFGVTVGCHATYDLLVGILLATHPAES